MSGFVLSCFVSEQQDQDQDQAQDQNFAKK
jgi:hypothetical protein